MINLSVGILNDRLYIRSYYIKRLGFYLLNHRYLIKVFSQSFYIAVSELIESYTFGTVV